jgi:surface antigen
VEYGDETDYYCTYMSLHDQQTGKPIPTLCEIPQQPTTSLASTASNVPLTAGKPFTGDDYAFGNCTYWVALRRSQIGAPIPNSWGNAATWATYAADDGYTVNHTPSYGAIMQTSDVDGGLGHVAFVESVDPNGTWHISEMNVIGFNEIDDRAMPASSAAQYEFIH